MEVLSSLIVKCTHLCTKSILYQTDEDGSKQVLILPSVILG
jgi:hypothetical protein